MKACRHYTPWSFAETEILPSSNRWNAWIITWHHGKIWDSGFFTGFFLEYLQHLRDNEECRNEIGVSLEEINRLLKEIEEEWKQAIGGGG
jgi:hypothetical protein